MTTTYYLAFAAENRFDPRHLQRIGTSLHHALVAFGIELGRRNLEYTPVNLGDHYLTVGHEPGDDPLFSARVALICEEHDTESEQIPEEPPYGSYASRDSLDSGKSVLSAEEIEDREGYLREKHRRPCKYGHRLCATWSWGPCSREVREQLASAKRGPE